MPQPHKIYPFRLSRRDDQDTTASSASQNSASSSALDSQLPDSIGNDLSIALVGPDPERRKAVAGALEECRGGKVREFSCYPPALDDVPRLLEQSYDVIMIDLDSDPEYALELIESISARNTATVMAYSSKVDREMVFRCMRAGAREFLTPPFDQNTMAEAMVRASAILHPETRPVKKTRGRLLVFLGAKGGSGVTTIACNYAIALAQESGQSTLLIDLGLPLGDAALNLGMVAQYSTDHAIQNADRLDASFFHKLLSKHRTGVSLLAAPSAVSDVQATDSSIDKLMAVARLEFENVVVDAGSRLDLMNSSLFKDASTIHLVTQAGISELRNSNRLISKFFNGDGPKLEIVINRYESSFLGVSEEHIAKALTKPVQWKIPDDYDAARQMQNSATLLTEVDSPISRMIRQMARADCGLPAAPEKKGAFGLRGLSKPFAEKVSISEETPSVAGVTPVIDWPAPKPITCGTPLSAVELNATASTQGAFAYTPGAGYMLPAGTHSLWVTFTPAGAASEPTVQASVSIAVSKATPTITWPAPPLISCGTPLSAVQLNAMASVPGTFTYTPAAGDVLDAGTHTLSATFTPNDTAKYETAQATVTVSVARAKPVIDWPSPAPIPAGSKLNAAHLNATASVPGTFDYAPAEGDVLPVGTHTLSAMFTPTDTVKYETVQTTATVTVARATPAISWPTPASIPAGSKLSANQLNATASVPGSFLYTPSEGAVLAPGAHTPTVIFIPADTVNYNTAHAAVSLTVAEAAPSMITWPAPAAITYGTALGASQLNATASGSGIYVYTPDEGAVLPAGMHGLSVIFIPTDTSKCEMARATVTLEVKELPDAASLHGPTMEKTFMQNDTADYSEPADVRREATLNRNAVGKKIETETRTYKGAVYEKGEDGQWHLQQK